MDAEAVRLASGADWIRNPEVADRARPLSPPCWEPTNPLESRESVPTKFPERRFPRMKRSLKLSMPVPALEPSRSCDKTLPMVRLPNIWAFASSATACQAASPATSRKPHGLITSPPWLPQGHIAHGPPFWIVDRHAARANPRQQARSC